MPFGIALHLPHFKTWLPLNLKQAVAYRADILVFVEHEREDREQIGRVFDRIRLAGLEISLDKFIFNKNELKFQGHIINNGGINKGIMEKLRQWKNMKAK